MSSNHINQNRLALEWEAISKERARLEQERVAIGKFDEIYM